MMALHYEFVPQRLIMTISDIKAMHKETAIVRDKFAEDKELEILVKKIVVKKKSVLKQYALALSLEKRYLLAAYLPYNFYAVDMSNLFIVLNHVMNDGICETLYWQWQYSYNNKECNKYIA